MKRGVVVNKDLTFWGMFAILWLFWIGITGSFDWSALIIGGGVAFFITRFNHDQLITARERPLFTFKNVIRLCRLLVIFIIAVFKANFQVAALVINPRLPINPQVVRVSVKLDKEVSRVILANAITLTPGTLTVLCNDEELLVHSLTEKHASEVKNWQLIEELRQLEE